MFISNSEGFTLTDDAVARLAALADGSMRDAVSLLDQCVSGDVVDLARVQDTLGLVGNQDLLELARMVADRDVISALSILDEIYNDGRDMASLLSEMTSLFRDLLVYKISPDSNLLSAGLDKNVLSGLSKKFSSERLFFNLDLLKNILFALSRSGSSKLAVEMCLIKMCEDNALTPAVSVANTDEIKSSAQNAKPQKSSEQSLYPKKEALIASVSSKNNEETQAVETDEPSPCHTVNSGNGEKAQAVKTDEPSPCLVNEHPDMTQEPSLCHTDNSEKTQAVETDEPSPCPKPHERDSDDFWEKTLELLKQEPSVRVLLNDSSKVQATLRDRVLTVNFTDSYTADQIKHSFSELVKDTAEKVLGHNVILNIEVVDSVDSDEIKRSKLDSLSAFDIVNFN